MTTTTLMMNRSFVPAKSDLKAGEAKRLKEIIADEGTI